MVAEYYNVVSSLYVTIINCECKFYLHNYSKKNNIKKEKKIITQRFNSHVQT